MFARRGEGGGVKTGGERGWEIGERLESGGGGLGCGEGRGEDRRGVGIGERLEKERWGEEEKEGGDRGRIGGVGGEKEG